MLCFLWMWTFTKCRENGDVACNRFTRPHLSSSSSWWGLTGPVPLSLYNPQRPTPTLSFLNHSDPTHLEPMCFSILSSTVVISNQPRSLKLLSTPLAHQRGLFTHLIPDRRWELKYYLPFLHIGYNFFSSGLKTLISKLLKTIVFFYALQINIEHRQHSVCSVTPDASAYLCKCKHTFSKRKTKKKYT